MSIVLALTAANVGVLCGSAGVFLLGCILLIRELRKGSLPGGRRLIVCAILLLQPLCLLVGLLNIVMYCGPLGFALVLWRAYEQCRRNTIDEEVIGRLRTSMN